MSRTLHSSNQNVLCGSELVVDHKTQTYVRFESLTIFLSGQITAYLYRIRARSNLYAPNCAPRRFYMQHFYFSARMSQKCGLGRTLMVVSIAILHCLKVAIWALIRCIPLKLCRRFWKEMGATPLSEILANENEVITVTLNQLL